VSVALLSGPDTNVVLQVVMRVADRYVRGRGVASEAPIVAQERLGFTNPKFQRRVTDTRVEVPDAELIEIATGDEALPPIPTLYKYFIGIGWPSDAPNRPNTPTPFPAFLSVS